MFSFSNCSSDHQMAQATVVCCENLDIIDRSIFHDITLQLFPVLIQHWSRFCNKKYAYTVCWNWWLESVKLLIVSNLFSGLMSNMFSVCKLIKLFRAWELTYRISVRISNALIRSPFLHTVFRLKKVWHSSIEILTFLIFSFKLF